VSSHLLSEIQAAADYLIVIRFGALLFAGPLDDLLERERKYVDIETATPAELEALRRHFASIGYEVEPDNGGLRVLVDPAESGSLNRTATELGITLTKLVPRSENLEDVFLRMTAGTPQQEQAA